MSGSSLTGMSNFSLLDLFREEVRTHGSAFTDAFAVLVNDISNAQNIEPLMRAAHSIKGAARIVKVEPAVLVSDAMQEVLLAAMEGNLTITLETLRVVERGMSILNQIALTNDDHFERWLPRQNSDVQSLLADLKAVLSGSPMIPSQPVQESGPVAAKAITRELRTDELTAEFIPTAQATSAKRGAPATLVDVFREEVHGQSQVLSEGLVKLERDPSNMSLIATLMRAAHTIKAASRIVNFDAAVHVAHALEDNLLAAQQGRLKLAPSEIDCLLRSVDLLASFANVVETEFANWLPQKNNAVQTLMDQLSQLAAKSSVADVQLPITASVEVPPAPSQWVDPTLLELFREEVANQSQALNDGLVQLEAEPQNLQLIDSLMRAAHSIKGAARIVNLEAAERVAHVLEDVLVAAQRHTITLTPVEIDLLLRGVDVLSEIGANSDGDTGKWLAATNNKVRTLIEQLTAVSQGATPPPMASPVVAPVSPTTTPNNSPADAVGQSGVYARGQIAARPVSPPTMVVESHDVIAQHPQQFNAGGPVTEERVVRVTAQNLSRLMSLAGESLVEARWLQPFAKSLQLLKQNQDRLAAVVAEMHLSAEALQGRGVRLLHEARQRLSECRDLLSDRIGVFEEHARQSDDLSSRLYYEVIASRLRPFADGIQGFPRMVRDLARKLGKKVKFEIHGHNTDVDRDILEKLEAPLNHLLRNALDHGLETPEQRAHNGKPEQGTLRLEARHRAGMLSITISDDGRGISLEMLRRKILEKGLSTPDLVANMNPTELLDFLFLSGFSTANHVTEVSGRGVGLDVVQSMVSAVGGSVRISSKLGEGSTFYLQLPITLSVLRAVLVTIGGEPYAFPHNRIDRLLRLPRSEIRSLEGQQYCSIDGRNVGLVMSQQVFDLALVEPAGEDLCVVLISDHHCEFGAVVDCFQGELDLVVRPLDTRLGKVANISAAALLEDGSPVLIVDVEDFLRSINNLLQRGRLGRAHLEKQSTSQFRKRILVVDDSITVREAERALLSNRGYDVQVAVDGMDGWNTIRDGNFDLVVSDIDMPRMNGLEFVKNIKQDPRLKGTPVVIVSYKGREEDRLRGMDAGADYYLSKASFHDETLLDAVVDLIGEPQQESPG